MSSNSEINAEDLIFTALSNRIRRGIIRVLGEKGKRSFTELMRDLNIDDTGTLTFHLKKLSGLITKTSDGYYTLTELGQKAYALLKSSKVSAEEVKETEVPKAKPVVEEVREKSMKPDLVILSNRLSLRIDRELLEKVKAMGRKLLVKDVVKVEIADDVDETLFNDVVESIEDVVTLKVPKHLETSVQLKAREVLHIVSSRGRVSAPSVVDIVTGIVEPVVSTVTKVLASVPFLSVKSGRGRELIYSSALGSVKVVKVDAEGGLIKVSQGDSGKIEVYSGRWGKCDFDVDVGEKGEIEINARGCEIYVTLPREPLEKLVADLSGGVLEASIDEGVKDAEISLSGGATKISLAKLRDSRISIDVSGGVAEAKLIYAEFSGSSKISLDMSGGIAKLSIEAPRNTLVTVSREGVGGYIDIDIDEELRAPQKIDRVINMALDVSGGFAEVSAKAGK